jgi:hypothetical protein
MLVLGENLFTQHLGVIKMKVLFAGQITTNGAAMNIIQRLIYRLRGYY